MELYIHSKPSKIDRLRLQLENDHPNLKGKFKVRI